MSGNRIAERKAAKLPCEWLVAKSGCSGALSFKRRWNTGDLQAEVRPSLPISLGKGPRPIKGLLVKRLRIGVGMALPVPGFKVRILRDPADTPQVEFRGLSSSSVIVMLSNAGSVVFQGPPVPPKAQWHRKTGALGSVCHRWSGLRGNQTIYPTALRDLCLTASITDEFPHTPPDRRPVPSGVLGHPVEMTSESSCQPMTRR